MVPCRSAQCNHSYCVSCSTAVLVILVILIVLLTVTVETGVWGRLEGWVLCGHVHTCVCMDMSVHVHACACVHCKKCGVLCTPNIFHTNGVQSHFAVIGVYCTP